MSTHSDENDKVLKDMYLALKPRTDSDTTINSVYPGPTRKTFDKWNETYYFQNAPTIKIEKPRPEHQQTRPKEWIRPSTVDVDIQSIGSDRIECGPSWVAESSDSSKKKFRPLLHHSRYGVAKTPSEENYFRRKFMDNDNVEYYKTDKDEPEWIHPESFLRPMVANADTLSIASAYVDITPGFLAKDRQDIQSMMTIESGVGDLVLRPHTLQGGAGTTGKDEDPCIISKKPKAMSGPLLDHSRFGVAMTQSEENDLRGRYFDNENVEYYKADEDETGCVDTRNMDELAEAVLEMERLAHQYRSSDQLSDFQDPGCCSVQSNTTAEENQFRFLKGDPIFNDIMNKTFEACVLGKSIENKMLLTVFKDLDLAQWKMMIAQPWLPHIPKSTKKHFSSYDNSSFFREAYYLIQLFNQGLGQMVSDQIIIRGPFLADYEKIAKHCDLLTEYYSLTMNKLKIANYSTVQRAAMPQMYREAKVKICREIRDYIILTQYIKACSYMCRGFCYLFYEFTF